MTIFGGQATAVHARAVTPSRGPLSRWTLLTGTALALLLNLGGPTKGIAQDAVSDKPLSAINWLTQSLDAPRATPTALVPTPSTRDDISENALPEDVTSGPIDAPRIDAVGLLSTAQTGLPRDLWGASKALDLSRRLTSISQNSDLLPASRRLLNTLILAELDPPLGMQNDGRLFLARVDALLSQGLIEEADALMQRAGSDEPEVFRRAFDAKLLMGTESEACAQLKTTRGLSPALPTRIFCLARDGDWRAAALTLETSTALGLISIDDGNLLARFLDPELFEGEPALPIPDAPTPLIFTMMDAIGEPIPTQSLPLAFAQSDLRQTAGWKVRATAAERLARVGALTPNRWLGIWSEHLPAASGGIWDRIEALQRFETALNTGDPNGVSHSLGRVWTEMGESGLQIVFADLFAQKLSDAPLAGKAADVAFEVALLSPSYEIIAANWDKPLSKNAAFARDIALGEVPSERIFEARKRAIVDGFRNTGIPVRLSGLVQSNRLGEAILRAIELLEGGATGDLDELTDALQFFRAVGLEATARRAALEILLLERRG
ncbi:MULTISPECIES: hypothetical protein [Pacificibacter]|uniref:hypothetical protein n=1 Tax=Pacificibacter TaxID=1042323 RepID=UPI001C0934C0|nr:MULTISPECIES: hypothetical protein [Pacificibacter]MBU2936873.1 hypothetical protein [Pacificibacter marinus]MDO6614867.1 hypothetical protein [Pacificibacter sp. 1_MG-2023]